MITLSSFSPRANASAGSNRWQTGGYPVALFRPREPVSIVQEGGRRSRAALEEAQSALEMPGCLAPIVVPSEQSKRVIERCSHARAFLLAQCAGWQLRGDLL